MAINERLIDTEVAAAADGGAASAEQNLILHLDANDVDSYDGDGSVWYDISEHDLTIPLSDNASNLKCHLNFSDSTSYGGTGTTVTDISDESNDFTFTGITASDFDKDNGGYVDLDNSGDYLERSSTTSGHFDGDYTLELWVNPHENNNFTYFYCKQNASTNGLLIGNFGGATGQLEVYRYRAGTSASSADTFTGSGITINQWNHVVIVFSGSNGYLYVNGELKDSSSIFTQTYPADFTNMRIGGGYSTAYDTNGEIGVFRLYDKALSASEVGQNYRHGRDYIYTDLVDDTDLEQHLDPADTNSYSGTGTAWNDLIGTYANATVVASTYDEELGNSFDITNNTITLSGDAGSLDGTSFTFETWLWQDSNSGTQYFFSDTGISLFTVSGTQMRFIKGFSGTNNDTAYFNPTSNSSGWATNKWNHVAVTFSSTTAKIYINGVLVKTNTQGSGTGTAIATYQISPSAGRWKGKMGQYRVYSTALTADEVMQNYLFTKNDYPNTNHGTISGATFDSSGYFDFERSSSNNVTISDSSSLDINGDITLLAWINEESVANYGRLFWKSGAYALYRGTNGWTFLLGSTSLVHNSGIPSTGTWYHIAATYDGSNQKLYINGVLVDTESMTGSIPTNNNSLYIGGDTTDRYFDGKIGAAKIYSKALTASELLADYNATKSTFGL